MGRNKGKMEPILGVFHEAVVPNFVELEHICNEDGTYMEMVNRTNNALERYSKRFNGLFPKKPSLVEFFQNVEVESRWQAERLNDLRSEKAQQKDHAEPTIPEISEEYKQWKIFHVDHNMI